MGEMKIDIKPEAKPIKKRPYKLAHKYNEIVKKEIDKPNGLPTERSMTRQSEESMSISEN